MTHRGCGCCTECCGLAPNVSCLIELDTAITNMRSLSTIGAVIDSQNGDSYRSPSDNDPTCKFFVPMDDGKTWEAQLQDFGVNVNKWVVTEPAPGGQTFIGPGQCSGEVTAIFGFLSVKFDLEGRGCPECCSRLTANDCEFDDDDVITNLVIDTTGSPGGFLASQTGSSWRVNGCEFKVRLDDNFTATVEQTNNEYQVTHPNWSGTFIGFDTCNGSNSLEHNTVATDTADFDIVGRSCGSSVPSPASPGGDFAPMGAFAHSVEERRAFVYMPGKGPGTELTAEIPDLFKQEGCGCVEYAQKMDLWGPDECKQRSDEIVDRLVSGTKIPNLVAQPVAKRWVRLAIEKAREQTWNSDANGEWFVGIQTAPRPHPTLVKCIHSLREADLEPVVFAEPGSLVTNAKTVWNGERMGVWRNWVNSVRWALENTKASLIMLVQDDSLFHPDSRTFAESILWPSKNTGFVSLYASKAYTRRSKTSIESPGVFQVKTTSLWGVCAVVWPREILERAIQLPIVSDWLGAKTKSGDPAVIERRRLNPSLIANSDTAMGEICNTLKREMWFVHPSPVQHIAKASTIGHGDNTGVRNCWECADHGRPLADQVPLPDERFDFE